jgi:hypothetical protein
MKNRFNVPELLMSVAAQMRAALRESLIPILVNSVLDVKRLFVDS